jgi:hypothetical protein
MVVVVTWRGTLTFGVTVTAKVPDFVESSVDVAVTVSDPEVGTVAGAV